MPLFSIERNDIRTKISFLGLKISYSRLWSLLKNNKIYILKQNGQKKRVYFVRGIKFKFFGKGAVCFLPEKNVFKNCRFDMYENSFVEIKNPQNNWIDDLYLETGPNCKTVISDECKMVDVRIYNAGPDCNVIIGKDCMFSNNVLIRTHDGHAILDAKTKQVLNFPKDVVIGNHVWIAKNAAILKGVNICDNIVVAANSLLNKSFKDSNIILAGNPAKIVKTGVNWDFRSCTDYLKEEGAGNG